MKLQRIAYDPGAVLDFYEESLAVLGALCDRTWHDRLEVVAEGRAASLWQTDGSLHAVELRFAPADASSARDAATEVFPGSPLTFRLAEALWPSPLTLERVALKRDSAQRPPDAAVAEKLWRGQFPDTGRWRISAPFKTDFHFSLLMLARCEIQAIDQHWSLHRVAVSLPDGALDDGLAQQMAFADTGAESNEAISWPKSEPARWRDLLQGALERDVGEELKSIRARQENSLRRELERIDAYFESYARELGARAERSSNKGIRSKGAERLAATKAEHARRRADQVTRHEIRIRPQIDALILVAEPAWQTELHIERAHHSETIAARFVPRARRWEASPR